MTFNNHKVTLELESKKAKFLSALLKQRRNPVVSGAEGLGYNLQDPMGGGER
jgi:hypothetical protein